MRFSACTWRPIPQDLEERVFFALKPWLPGNGLGNLLRGYMLRNLTFSWTLSLSLWACGFCLERQQVVAAGRPDFSALSSLLITVNSLALKLTLVIVYTFPMVGFKQHCFATLSLNLALSLIQVSADAPETHEFSHIQPEKMAAVMDNFSWPERVRRYSTVSSELCGKCICVARKRST